MILSILICTIESRKEQFDKLVSKLIDQEDEAFKKYRYHVEIINICDNKEMSVGLKRQFLLEQSIGKYVVFIDDDDDIPDYYIDRILDAIFNYHPSSIGFKIECDMEGKKETAIASNRYDDWCENKDGFKYCRTPYHKTPIKREIALQIGYKDMRFGEDYDYSKRLKESGLISATKEYFINEVMYLYNYKFEDPKTKYGIKD